MYNPLYYFFNASFSLKRHFQTKFVFLQTMDNAALIKKIETLQKKGVYVLSKEDKKLLKNLDILKKQAESKAKKTNKKSIPFHSSLSL